jgi:Lhr-like helicase
MEELRSFHPAVSRWFLQHYPEPTGIQRQAWEAAADGAHFLAIAPTGTGKTLAAFLWELNLYHQGVWSTGITRVLYVYETKRGRINRHPIFGLVSGAAIPPRKNAVINTKRGVHMMTAIERVDRLAGGVRSVSAVPAGGRAFPVRHLVPNSS